MGVLFHLEMLADWHVGSGTGVPGYVDKLVRRDPDGMPFVPGKTVKGVWRDSCETVAFGLDQGAKSQSWSRLVKLIFGEEAAAPSASRVGPSGGTIAALTVTAARLPESLAAVLRTVPGLAAELTILKPGVSIDGETGQAKTDFYRVEEMVRGGTRLVGDYELATDSWPATIAEQADALLAAGALVLERLGGKRRRGAGECRMTLGSWAPNHKASAKLEDSRIAALSRPVEEDDLSAVHDCLLAKSQAASAPTGALTSGQGAASTRPVSSGTSGDFIDIEVELELTTPAVVAERTLGNLVRTRTFIPGTQLLGHFRRKLSAILGRSLDDEISSGSLRVTNAYPTLGATRSMPVPYAWHYDKDRPSPSSGTKVWNRTSGTSIPETLILKALRSGYVAPGENDLVLYSVTPTSVVTHSVIHDASQRPTSEVGGVYTYEAIQSGCRFRANLRLSCEVYGAMQLLAPNWRDKMGDSIRIGSSKSVEYGQANLRIVGVPREGTTVGTSSTIPAEATIGSAAAQQGRRCISLWLVADALVRGTDLTLAPSLETLVGAVVKHCEEGVSVEAGIAHLRASRSEGWNVNWGLPRHSQIGYAGGSCLELVLTADSEGAIDRSLRRLAVLGIGERCAEGFGEVRVNDPLLAKGEFKIERDSPRASTSAGVSVIAKADEGFEYAQVLESAAWRRLVRRRAEIAAGSANPGKSPLGWSENKPTNSQLGTLRGMLTASSTAKEFAAEIQAWSQNLVRSRKRRDSWPQPAITALQELAAGDGGADKLWNLLGIDPAAVPIATTHGQQRFVEEMRYEALRSLLLLSIRGRIERSAGSHATAGGAS